jgi:hypothetical protein
MLSAAALDPVIVGVQPWGFCPGILFGLTSAYLAPHIKPDSPLTLTNPPNPT